MPPISAKLEEDESALKAVAVEVVDGVIAGAIQVCS